MLSEVYIAGDNITSALGMHSQATFKKVQAGTSGIKKVTINGALPIEMYASLLTEVQQQILNDELSPTQYTRLEQLLIHSISDATKLTKVDLASPKTGIIIATTKGNIDMLHEGTYPTIDNKRLYPAEMAKAVSAYFNNPNYPIIISNACISGVIAITTGALMIRSGKYDQVIVSGGDIINDFTASGFQSFKAVSDSTCQPFDTERQGLNLGEGAATIVLSKEKNGAKAKVLGGASSNDANHISGPSRDGSGLKAAIKKALQQSEIVVDKIDAISAHGTATPYNDEMEAIAFDDLGLNEVPVNSLKTYFGHTLGAAGIIESVISLHAMQQNTWTRTLGYRQHGVSRPIHITAENEHRAIDHILKTASGFGGCNAAVIFEKI